MIRTAAITKYPLVVAIAAVGASGISAPPVARAETVCSVPGEYLELRQTNDVPYTVIIEAHGTSLGPSGLARATPEQATYGTVVGSVAGRHIDFEIAWNDPKTRARFTGTVGDDGIAQGTASGQPVPINLWRPGTWNSTTVLNCTADGPPPPPEQKPLQGPLVTTDTGLTGVTFHVTDRSGVASQCTYSSEGFDKQFALPANATVDVFVPAIRQFRNRTGTITCDNKTSTNTSVF